MKRSRLRTVRYGDGSVTWYCLACDWFGTFEECEDGQSCPECEAKKELASG